MKNSWIDNEQYVLLIFSIASSIIIVFGLFLTLAVCACCAGVNQKPTKGTSSQGSVSAEQDDGLKSGAGSKKSSIGSPGKASGSPRLSLKNAHSTVKRSAGVVSTKEVASQSSSERGPVIGAYFEPPPIVELISAKQQRPVSGEYFEPPPVHALVQRPSPGQDAVSKQPTKMLSTNEKGQIPERQFVAAYKRPVAGQYFEPPPVNELVQQRPSPVESRDSKRPSKKSVKKESDQTAEKIPLKSTAISTAKSTKAVTRNIRSSKSPIQSVAYRVLTEAERNQAEHEAVKHRIVKSPFQLAGPVEQRRALPKAAYISAHVWRPPPPVAPAQSEDANNK